MLRRFVKRTLCVLLAAQLMITPCVQAHATQEAPSQETVSDDVSGEITEGDISSPKLYAKSVLEIIKYIVPQSVYDYFHRKNR